MASRSAGLSRKELERYSRQIVLTGVGPDGQRKLKRSKILVVGAGGLGIPSSVYLAAAGVGEIGVVDSDAFERSPLHRQTIYSEADVGRAKAVVAAKRLRQVNPNISIVPHRLRLDSTNALRLISGYDMVLDCTDNFPARYLINDACVLLGKPDVYASVFRFYGQASVFAEDGPCYRCLYPEPPPPDTVQDCAEAGVLGVLPGIMGSIQAVQAINLILGKGRPLVGRLLLFNAMDMAFDEIRVRKNPECPVCGPSPKIKHLVDYEEFCGTKKGREGGNAVSPRELKRILNNGRRVVLLDVREPNEHGICHLEGSKLIPLGDLRARSAELDGAEDIVVYCHIGTRSAAAVGLLRSLGFRNVRNLKGGIRAWAQDVVPTMAVY